MGMINNSTYQKWKINDDYIINLSNNYYFDIKGSSKSEGSIVLCWMGDLFGSRTQKWAIEYIKE
jgi:hypothetical protein